MLGTDPEGVFTSRALTRAGVWLIWILLASVVVIVGVLSAFPPPSGGQAELSRALVPMAALVALGGGAHVLLLGRGAAATIIALLVVCAAAFVYSLGVEPLLLQGQKSDSIALSLPVVAATVSGVGRRSLTACLVICGLGYVVAASAAVLGADLGGRAVVLDFTAFGSFLAVSLLLVVLWLARRGAVQQSSALERAAKKQQVIVEEARLLGHASSLLHDTVLGDLHAIAMLSPGPIPDGHLAVVRRDLELLENSAELMRAPGSARLPELIGTTSESSLARMLDRVGVRGLRVVVSGDVAQLTTLDPAGEEALVGAIEQCLVNVVVHAGVSLAELAVLVTNDEVTAMIADSGLGFVASSTPADRLGLRLSVHDRMLGVGGSATVWSRPGAGTSVLLTVPRSGA